MPYDFIFCTIAERLKIMAEDTYSSTDSEEIKQITSSMAQHLGYQKCLDENLDDRSNLCQIHRVHQLVRQIDRFAYEPSVLSVGPYHHSNNNLQFMEKMKWRCLDYVLNLNCTKSMRDYLLAIRNIEHQARACYSDEIYLDSKSFRRMLLLDGCLILVYLGGTHGVSRITEEAPGCNTISDDNINGTGCVQQAKRSLGNSPKQNLVTHEIDPEIVDGVKVSSDIAVSSSCSENSGVPWYHNFALVDLFLLENQIPFFVVRKLHGVLVGSDEKTLTESVSNYIEENLQYFIGAFGPFEKPNDFCHLLHLCHMHFKPRMIQQEASHVWPQFGEYFIDIFFRLLNMSRRHGHDEWSSSQNQKLEFLQGGQVTRWRRATQYYEAGIVFKRKVFNGQNTQSLLDVTFNDGVLEIPCIFVDDRTGSLFRNMLAFEQTNPHFGNCVTAYFMFMSQLISRPNDVTLLSHRGIIVHNLHSDKVVSSLFTRLTKGVVFDFVGDFYLRSICWRMEMYYQSRTNRWIAWLSHNHLSNPWLGLALLAGLLVLFCTIAQTVLTVLSYLRLQ